MRKAKPVADDSSSLDDLLLLELDLATSKPDATSTARAEVTSAKRAPRKLSSERATASVAVPCSLLIDAPALAGLLSVSEATLYRMLAAGKVPAPLRLSRGCVRWHRETVERWLALSEAQGRLIDRATWETLSQNANGKPR